MMRAPTFLVFVGNATEALHCRLARLNPPCSPRGQRRRACPTGAAAPRCWSTVVNTITRNRPCQGRGDWAPESPFLSCNRGGCRVPLSLPFFTVGGQPWASRHSAHGATRHSHPPSRTLLHAFRAHTQPPPPLQPGPALFPACLCAIVCFRPPPSRSCGVCRLRRPLRLQRRLRRRPCRQAQARAGVARPRRR